MGRDLAAARSVQPQSEPSERTHNLTVAPRRPFRPIPQALPAPPPLGKSIYTALVLSSHLPGPETQGTIQGGRSFLAPGPHDLEQRESLGGREIGKSVCSPAGGSCARAPQSLARAVAHPLCCFWATLPSESSPRGQPPQQP